MKKIQSLFSGKRLDMVDRVIEIGDAEGTLTIKRNGKDAIVMSNDLIRQLKVWNIAEDVEINVERDWKEFWKEIVCDANGDLNLDNIKAELSDYKRFMTSCSQVYFTITGGLVSKINCNPNVVIGLYEDEINRQIEEGVKERFEEIKEDFEKEIREKVKNEFIEKLRSEFNGTVQGKV